MRNIDWEFLEASTSQEASIKDRCAREIATSHLGERFKEYILIRRTEGNNRKSMSW